MFNPHEIFIIFNLTACLKFDKLAAAFKRSSACKLYNCRRADRDNLPIFRARDARGTMAFYATRAAFFTIDGKKTHTYIHTHTATRLFSVGVIARIERFFFPAIGSLNKFRPVSSTSFFFRNACSFKFGLMIFTVRFYLGVK